MCVGSVKLQILSKKLLIFQEKDADCIRGNGSASMKDQPIVIGATAALSQ
jgi:hypothetical protein